MSNWTDDETAECLRDENGLPEIAKKLCDMIVGQRKEDVVQLFSQIIALAMDRSDYMGTLLRNDHNRVIIIVKGGCTNADAEKLDHFLKRGEL